MISNKPKYCKCNKECKCDRLDNKCKCIKECKCIKNDIFEKEHSNFFSILENENKETRVKVNNVDFKSNILDIIE